jgi:hypothetical protein
MSESLHQQPRTFGKVAFSPKPVFHRGPELLERDVVSDFEHPIADGQRIVKNTGVSEIPHAEAVEPLQRACVTLPLVLVLDANLASEHQSIKSQSRESLPACPQACNPDALIWQRPGAADSLPCREPEPVPAKVSLIQVRFWPGLRLRSQPTSRDGCRHWRLAARLAH